jgi:hypothetical protein
MTPIYWHDCDGQIGRLLTVTTAMPTNGDDPTTYWSLGLLKGPPLLIHYCPICGLKLPTPTTPPTFVDQAQVVLPRGKMGPLPVAEESEGKGG